LCTGIDYKILGTVEHQKKPCVSAQKSRARNCTC